MYNRETFEEAMEPAIKWLNENCNPHSKIIITHTDAELVAGEMCFKTEEFIKD